MRVGKREEINVNIKKPTGFVVRVSPCPPLVRVFLCVRSRTYIRGGVFVCVCVCERVFGRDGETDISIAKGFDNQKGPAAAAVTARRIRSFRHANLCGRDRAGRGGVIACVCARQQIAALVRRPRRPYGNRRRRRRRRRLYRPATATTAATARCKS